MLRLSMASVGEEELQALKKVLFETVNFGLGVHVKEFEDEIKKFLNHKELEVVCVNTGTSALHLALESLSFPVGSEVLVPSLTFLASYSAISAAGLKPVSCEVTFPDCHIDVHDMEKRITEKTVAIMPVAYAGCDFDRKNLYEIANKHKLRVIEDDAHAFGSLNHDAVLFGASGDVVCFSFDGIKNITCGEGGAIVTKDKDLAHKIRVRRSLGIEKDVELRYQGTRAWDYDVSVQGFRYHMSNLNAVIGSEQLKKLGKFQIKKQKLLEAYLETINSLALTDFLIPTQKAKTSDILHIFSCVLPEGLDRVKFRSVMSAAGFETGIHYPPNHLHTYYKTDYSLPVCENLGSRLVSFPFHPAVPLSLIPRMMQKAKEAMSI